ncbi:dUTPase-like protein [Phyllosticta paracitricarpa]
MPSTIHSAVPVATPSHHDPPSEPSSPVRHPFHCAATCDACLIAQRGRWLPLTEVRLASAKRNLSPRRRSNWPHVPHNYHLRSPPSNTLISTQPHKRTKHIEPEPASSVDNPALVQASAVGDLSGNATPTPANVTTMAAAQETLQVQLVSKTAQLPKKGSTFAAGYDIYSSETVTIPKRGRGLVPTGIRIALPAGTYGRIAPRSGLAAKHGIDTLAGVIDADYRGDVGVLLANLSDEDFDITPGDRIAQLVVERIALPEIVAVEKLDETVRGAGGFGSTGGFGTAAATVEADAEKVAA